MDCIFTQNEEGERGRESFHLQVVLYIFNVFKINHSTGTSEQS